MEDMAYCGYFCSGCPVYQADLCGDMAEKERLARQYSTSDRPLTAANMYCRGCGKEEGELPAFCRECFIRSCAQKRKLPHCGACAEFPCAYWRTHIPADSPSRILLEQYRAGQ